jgi:asparagine synthase (glutamine-hydrolysing)
MHYSKKTFFKQINLLPAGSFILLNNSECTLRYYWQLSLKNISYRKKIDIEEVQNHLNNSIKLRLRSDVPVGVLLSGGLDSSVITALASKHYESKLKAFSLVFNDSNSNEFEHAKKVALQCEVDLHLLKPEGEGLWEEIDSLIRAQDAPTHAPEVYSNWCMMRSVAKCDLKVLLCGQGGDEIFCGYNWYPKHFLFSLLKNMKFNTFIHELLSLPINFPNTNTQKKHILLSLVLQAILPNNIKRRLKPELTCMNQILMSSYRNEMGSRDISNISLLDPPTLEEKMYNDLTRTTVPQYVHYEDSNAMAFGIEERVPMLDHNLVEWMHRLSIEWKLKNGTSKYPLREAMRLILPDEIVNRKDKMGLSAPRDLWFRHELRLSIESLFRRDCMIYEKLINRSVFRSQLKAYMIGKSIPLSRVLWRIINIEKWFKIYFN